MLINFEECKDLYCSYIHTYVAVCQMTCQPFNIANTVISTTVKPEILALLAKLLVNPDSKNFDKRNIDEMLAFKRTSNNNYVEGGAEN